MKPHWLAKLPPAWRSRLTKLGYNWFPAFRSNGGWIEHVSADLTHIRVRLPNTWRTRNIVGSTYGGSLFAITDGMHPTMLMAALGKDVIVWDKAASIRYRKPGFTTLYADFHLSAKEVAEIRAALEMTPALDRIFTIELKDSAGVVHAEVERTVYIAQKAHYKDKTARGDQHANSH